MQDHFTKSFKNPYYFTLILVTLTLILIFYSYDILDQNFSNHIKFFIYNYIIFSLLFLFYNSIVEDELLIKHGLKKNFDVLQEITNNIETSF